ncbi:N-acyl homoserine lactonase family protein [Rhodocytophaga aerolata]|uniref:N-acyl homoserine lactonase family protein n=1 Tax=Rhodocytophaga aerolata TaxID=455078 RepID=A0ABT8RJG2_9BACT|nr:N-acyl homoserine lactonase family protein [Rhodocytophaga aerolata]MDO1451554.1 N-acyl homoserine lactonase family protein [Rhodocytophaga aerolata]
METRRNFIGKAGWGAASALFAPTSMTIFKGLSNEQNRMNVLQDTESPKIGNTGAIDRLYLLNGGFAIAPDKSMYTPGKWKGEQITLCCHAYLMKRQDEWILWDTGIEDDIIHEPGGKIIAHNIRGIVVRTIRSQLADIGIRTEDISKVILSHAHFDHVGNAKLFPSATWHIQYREHEAMFGLDYAKYGYLPSLYETLKGAKVKLMKGDYDLYGDGSIKVISTPGHTPGHCSLLVRLPKTGPVMLAGDVAHFTYNLEHHQVPSMNSDYTESLNSMKRVEEIVQEEKARLWLNHDISQMATLPQAPSFLE